MALDPEMWILKISGVETSSHSLEVDALAQKARFIADGVTEESITITAPQS